MTQRIANNYQYSVHSFSETGPVRTSNEDSTLICYPEENTVFAIVADGIGGRNAGEVASNIACTAAREYITAYYSQRNVLRMLTQMMQHLHQTIQQAAGKNNALEGMGTTATAIFIRQQIAGYAHIGDSRLYHWRNGLLLQCTKDDTLVSQMLKEGLINASEAMDHPKSNVLTQSLGAGEHITPQISTGIPVKIGDRFFLCTDGVYNILQQDELKLLMQIQHTKRLAESVKQICLQRIASDNFSGIIIQVDEIQ